MADQKSKYVERYMDLADLKDKYDGDAKIIVVEVPPKKKVKRGPLTQKQQEALRRGREIRQANIEAMKKGVTISSMGPPRSKKKDSKKKLSKKEKYYKHKTKVPSQSSSSESEESEESEYPSSSSSDLEESDSLSTSSRDSMESESDSGEDTKRTHETAVKKVIEKYLDKLRKKQELRQREQLPVFL